MQADYWDVWSALLRDNFFRVQADWCASNGLEYIVHLNQDDNMPALVPLAGDYFRAMRSVQVPGVDAMVWGCSCRGVPWRRHFPVLNAKLQDLARQADEVYLLVAGLPMRLK